jgi:hypothetical protein
VETRNSFMLLKDWIEREKKATEGGRGGEMLTCQQMAFSLNE